MSCLTFKFLVLPIVAYIALIKHSQLSCIMFVKSDEECQVAMENLEKNRCAIHCVRQAGAGGWSWSAVRKKYCYLAGGWRLKLE